MPATGNKLNLPTAICLCLIGVAGLCAPTNYTEVPRSAVRDMARPGQIALLHAIDWCRQTAQLYAEDDTIGTEISSLEAQLRHAKQLARHLALENADLHQQLADLHASQAIPLASAQGTPLVVPDLLEARVLGTETSERWRSGRLIDAGSSGGIEESAFVLEDLNPLIDQGENAALTAGQPVYSGATVMGRVSRVGRWTSTVQPITDREFRGHARLIRQTSRGTIFGAEGILQGEGTEVCQLRFVNSTNPVSVGDEVVTANHSGEFPFAMHYGTVIKAELPAGVPHWEIWVKPAASDQIPTRVQVLRKSLNPIRLLAD